MSSADCFQRLHKLQPGPSAISSTECDEVGRFIFSFCAFLALIGAIEDARQKGKGLAISDITLLNLATLSNKGRIRLDISLESFLHDVQARFIVLPMSGRACVRALGLPAAYSKHPADRIVGGTALIEGLPLLAADRAIRRSRALHTIW